MTAKRFNIPHSLSPLSEHIYNFLLRRRRRMLFTSLQRASFSRIPFSSDWIADDPSRNWGVNGTETPFPSIPVLSRNGRYQSDPRRRWNLTARVSFFLYCHARGGGKKQDFSFISRGRLFYSGVIRVHFCTTNEEQRVNQFTENKSACLVLSIRYKFIGTRVSNLEMGDV